MKCYYQIEEPDWRPADLHSHRSGREIVFQEHRGEDGIPGKVILLLDPEILFWDGTCSITGMSPQGDSLYKMVSVSVVFTKPRSRGSH